VFDALGDLLALPAVQAKPQIYASREQCLVEAELHGQRGDRTGDPGLGVEQRVDFAPQFRADGLTDELVPGVPTEAVGHVDQEQPDCRETDASQTTCP
jgi:hypothetical protein